MRIYLLIFGLLTVSFAKECGKNSAACKSGKCCSYWGYCGTTADYCGSGTYQCACDCTAKGGCMTSTSTTTTTTSSTTCNNYSVIATSLNIRSGPGTGYSIVGSYNYNTVVCVVAFEQNNTWAKLSTGKYVSAQYLKQSSSSSTTTTTTTTPTVAGDKRMCSAFWDNYAKNRYPTQAEFAQGTRDLVGKIVTYTMLGKRWSGIEQKVCPPSVPPHADCSSYATWMYWTAFGGLADKVNNSSWKAGYTGTMQTVGKKQATCALGDSYQYNGHATIWVGNNEVVSFGLKEGMPDPVRLKKYDYRNDRLGCYRYDLPFGQSF